MNIHVKKKKNLSLFLSPTLQKMQFLLSDTFHPTANIFFYSFASQISYVIFLSVFASRLLTLLLRVGDSYEFYIRSL